MPILSLIIINYNGLKYLKNCLDSIKDQTYNKEIFFIDNASSDKSIEFVQTFYPFVKIFPNQKNFGYSKAANQGIGLAKSRYVMILNPDVILEKDYLEKIINKMEQDHRIAAITGKIKKYDFDNNQKTNIIDSVGHYCFRNRRIIDQGQGLEDKGQLDKSGEVFSVSGSCPLYRREDLLKSAIFGEIFDEDFFMYKEDIDLGWRLRLFGYKCYYLPAAVAYHCRGTGVLKRFSHWEVLQNRKHLNRFQKSLAFRNQRLMQVKNELIDNFVHDFFSILWKETLILGYITLREPYLLKSLFQFLFKFPKALKKRKEIMKRKKVDWRKMRRWVEGRSV